MVVAESFLPHMNGVTNSVLKVLTHLRRRGDEVTVVAPADSFTEARWWGRGRPDSAELCEGYPVIRVPSVPLPEYPRVRVAAGFVKGIRQHVGRMHRASTTTLVPSSFSRRQLALRGVQRLRTWRRGVDAQQFAPTRRSTQLRTRIAPEGELLIGFVGRLAAEKQVQDLGALDGIPGTRLVIIGSGPQEAELRRRLPRAHFAGFQSAESLGAHVASLDVFVHPGEAETFCQTIQEAFAAAVPVVAVGRGGPLDLVDPGRTGWLYAPGDLAGMRSAVEHLAGSPEARSRFARQAHSVVSGRSWEAICNQLVGHYARSIEVNERLHASRAKSYIAAGGFSGALLPSRAHPGRAQLRPVGASAHSDAAWAVQSRPEAFSDSEMSFPSGP